MTPMVKRLAGFVLVIAVSVVVGDALGDWAASRIGEPWWLPWLLLGLFWAGMGAWMWRHRRASGGTGSQGRPPA